jgi:hypothetical protein
LKKIVRDVKVISQEYIEMLQTLEEGIIVIKDNSIDFSNDISKKILSNVKFVPQQGIKD